MMKGKMVVISCILLLYILSGCRLAREELSASNYEDRFVGFFITYEYVDLFDMEGYLNDHVANVGFNITAGGNSEKYQGRLYAQLVKGEAHGLVDYIFPDIEGITYFTAVVVPESESGNSFTTSISDAAISDGSMHVATGDNEKSTVLTGTLYVSPRSGIEAYYFNPVYQSADGSVYLTAGSGISALGVQDEGSVMSTSMDSETTITENGKEKTEKVSVTVSVSTMLPPSKIAVLQMDENNSLVMRTEYANDFLPESIDIESEVSYIIVEAHKQKNDGSENIAREIYERDDNAIGIFSDSDNGVCIKQWIQINW